MSRLFNGKDQLVHPPQAATYDPIGWSYTHSFNMRPLSSHDAEAHNYKTTKQAASGGGRGGQPDWAEAESPSRVGGSDSAHGPGSSGSGSKGG